VCNEAHDNCFYCGEEDCGDLGCCPGCHDTALNCKENYECNLDTHKCEEMICTEDTDCVGFDEVCNEAHDNCFYCGEEDCGDLGCCPGCHDTALNCKENYECNLDTHKCEEMICTEDNMCEGFDQVCNDANDNCFYCGECGDLGCCPGCHDTDLNCKAGDFCNLDTHECEPTDKCKTDLDCNQDVSGVCDVGNAIYEECFYCSMSASGNTCEPGCKYDGPTDQVPSCPAAPSPICNEQTHRCDAAEGHQLLTYIKVTSNGCDGCDEEGLSMRLVGDDEVVPVPECETVGLDHPGKVDYVSVAEFRAVEAERPMGWGSCYESPLDGKITSASVTWTGTGTWRGDSICFDWNANRKVYVCQLPAGSSLANGETAQLTCASGEGIDCP